MDDRFIYKPGNWTKTPNSTISMVKSGSPHWGVDAIGQRECCMSHVRPFALKLLLPCALVLSALVTVPTASSADEVGTQGWRGPCYPQSQVWPGYFGGWCDGNGPESYQAVAECTQGVTRYGVVRWHGDRRGSWAFCPEATSLINGYFRFL